MPLMVPFPNRVEKARGRITSGWLEHRSRLTLCFSFPTGLAFRNPPEGRGPQDCIPVFAGKPSGYAEFLAVTGSRKGPNIPG